MKPLNLNRRNFIRIGAQTLTIPFLGSMPLMANAASASGSLKRVIFYTFHNAWYQDQVFPRSTNYTVGAGGVRHIPLNQISGDISPLFTAAKYGAIKSKMNVMRGFDVISQALGGGGHQQRYALAASDDRSGGAVKDSIDTVISNSNNFYPAAPFRKFLNVVPVSDINGKYNFSFQGGTERSQIMGPRSLFTEYFSESLPGGGGATTPTDQNAARRLAMNATMNRLSALSQSTQLSSADRVKMQEHSDLVRKMLTTLAPPAATSGTLSSCSKPVAPAGINESYTARTGITQRMRTLMDEIYMILSCQLTNVVSIQPCNGDDSGTLFTNGDNISDVYHQMAGHHHDIPRYLPAKTWIMDQILYLANLMNSRTESNGLTMLDNSLIVVVSNDGCSVHSSEDIPVITFGSLGGLIKTGNYINYQRPETRQSTGELDLINAPDASGNYYYRYNYNLGRPLGQLYTTLLNVLGIPHSGFGEYHDPAGNYAAFTSAAGKQASLPILT
jgi:Protein of unknown function (DUF1552)